jgi:hypothetical protein
MVEEDGQTGYTEVTRGEWCFFTRGSNQFKLVGVLLLSGVLREYVASCVVHFINRFLQPEPVKPPAEESKTSSLGGIDYESLTLMRLRQAERERLEREIREQEEND